MRRSPRFSLFFAALLFLSLLAEPCLNRAAFAADNAVQEQNAPMPDAKEQKEQAEAAAKARAESEAQAAAKAKQEEDETLRGD